MRVLVTGATGFVGRRLVNALLAAGDTPVAMTRKRERAERAGTEAGVEVREATLADPNQLVAAAEGCELVFHCAGEPSHGAAPAALPWLHVAAVENLLDACAAAGVRRMVMLSCANATLRNTDRLNLREQQAVLGTPLDAWCRTKLMGEEVALQRSGSRLEVSAIRPAFLWGPKDDVNLPSLCAEGLRGGIRLFGDGNGLFSSAHVDNVVHAMQLAATAATAPGQAFHVSDGAYQTSGEFFGALSKALELAPPRRGFYRWHYGTAVIRRRLGLGGPCPADVARRGRACLLDIQRAINDLGYAPVVDVDAGMRGLSAWAQTVGGAAAIAGQARAPAGAEVAAAFEHTAKALEGES